MSLFLYVNKPNNSVEDMSCRSCSVDHYILVQLFWHVCRPIYVCLLVPLHQRNLVGTIDSVAIVRPKGCSHETRQVCRPSCDQNIGRVRRLMWYDYWSGSRRSLVSLQLWRLKNRVERAREILSARQTEELSVRCRLQDEQSQVLQAAAEAATAAVEATVS